jgi:hypothetical protein
MNFDVVAILSAVNLLALWIFVFYFWRDYRVDAFRDHVFSIRDKMFLFAANGGVSFDDPAYTILRFRMNVFLRYGHEFTLTRALFVAFVSAPPTFRERQRWEKALEGLPPESRDALRQFSVTLSVAILQLMAYRSLLLYVFLRPIMSTSRIEAVIKKQPNLASTVERVESETLEDDARKNGTDCGVPVVA